MLVLLQHGPGPALVAHRLSVGAQLHALGEARRQLEEELQLPQQCVHPCRGKGRDASSRAPPRPGVHGRARDGDAHLPAW